MTRRIRVIHNANAFHNYLSLDYCGGKARATPHQMFGQAGGFNAGLQAFCTGRTAVMDFSTWPRGQ